MRIYFIFCKIISYDFIGILGFMSILFFYAFKKNYIIFINALI